MNEIAFLNEVIKTLKNITTPRYYRSERGFQTEFYRILSNNLDGKNIFPEDTILEAEVQKRNLEHYGITQRPDLLIHIPIETGLTENANENNFVNFAFKRLGNLKAATDDYDKLEQMFHYLNYEMGVFINIGQFPEIYLDNYQGNYRDKIHEFSIQQDGNVIKIKHAFFKDDTLIIKDITKSHFTHILLLSYRRFVKRVFH